MNKVIMPFIIANKQCDYVIKNASKQWMWAA